VFHVHPSTLPFPSSFFFSSVFVPIYFPLLSKHSSRLVFLQRYVDTYISWHPFFSFHLNSLKSVWVQSDISPLRTYPSSSKPRYTLSPNKYLKAHMVYWYELRPTIRVSCPAVGVA
jgi:hypothetical protein